VLPCLDEAAALPAVLAALPDWPVLVVDNGSTDDTAAVARAWGARVVVEPRRGYGAAVHTGLRHARADLVAVLDGDGSLDAAALLRSRGVPVHDIAPIRVGRRDALLALGVADRAFGYPLELLMRARRAGWRIEEVPVRYSRRAGGRSKVSGSVVGTARAVRDMGALLLTTR